MSTEVHNSPILRMRQEFWALEAARTDGGLMGIMPVSTNAQNDPSTSDAEGRYGLVGGLNGDEENSVAPANTTGARYGLVVEAQDTSYDEVARPVKTPRRRLVSSSVFERMMSNTDQSQRTRSRSVTSRPRGGRTNTIPSNQKLISTFITPKRGNGL